MIKVSEALHEKKISQIADQIKKQKKVKVVLIAVLPLRARPRSESD